MGPDVGARQGVPPLAFGQRRLMVNAVPNLVEHVGPARVPPEIVEPVIGADAIAVACLHAIRAWADECFQDKARDQPQVTLGVIPECDDVTPARRLQRLRFEHLAGPESLAANLVPD